MNAKEKIKFTQILNNNPTYSVLLRPMLSLIWII